MFSQKHFRKQKIWMWSIVFALLALGIAYQLFPFLVSGFRTGAGALLAIMYLAAYLFMVIALPLMVFALLRFVYRIFLRPYWRLWRIKRWRNGSGTFRMNVALSALPSFTALPGNGYVIRDAKGAGFILLPAMMIDKPNYIRVMNPKSYQLNGIPTADAAGSSNYRVCASEGDCLTASGPCATSI